jgi:hypothetical protein
MPIGPSQQGDMAVRSRSTAGHIGLLSLLLATAVSLGTGTLMAEEIPVRNPEGVTHGLLVLRTLKGRQLASGELIQVVRGNRVTSRLLFHFPDGSVHDETSVFMQRRRFRLLTYHLVQKGGAFKQPIEVAIERASGRVTVHTVNEEGERKVHVEKMKLPDDLANGMILTLLKNISPQSPSTTVSMVAAASKPRLVKLIITPSHLDAFASAGTGRQALHYVVKVDIPGVVGIIAPLIGKQPPDSHVWILGGEAPAFMKSESPLFAEGPLWRMELVSPVWPTKHRR